MAFLLPRERVQVRYILPPAREGDIARKSGDVIRVFPSPRGSVSYKACCAAFPWMCGGLTTCVHLLKQQRKEVRRKEGGGHRRGTE